MKNYLLLIIVALTVASCTEVVEENPVDNAPEVEDTPTVFSKDLVIRHIEAHLEIQATEEVSYEFFEEELNGDDSLDIVVTVNMLDRAINEAIESGKLEKRAELGFIGNFNYFFVVDGATKEIREPILVPSSPHAKLDVSFENIRTEGFKDILVDFRIRNSKYRRFFSMINKAPRELFEAKLYDGLGDRKTEAFIIKYETGSYSLAKDIVIYKGVLEDIEILDPKDVYSIDPQISETTELERRWFFNDAQQKYFTEK